MRELAAYQLDLVACDRLDVVGDVRQQIPEAFVGVLVQVHGSSTSRRTPSFSGLPIRKRAHIGASGGGSFAMRRHATSSTLATRPDAAAVNAEASTVQMS